MDQLFPGMQEETVGENEGLPRPLQDIAVTETQTMVQVARACVGLFQILKDPPTQ